MKAHKRPDSLGEVMAIALPGGIEAQEAAGQSEFCATDVLPKVCPRKELEAFGVKFGTDHDDLFVNVTLPAGWKKNATDHSMHSDLLDEKGRKRASIFYKAAFYDRKADMYLTPRYRVNRYQESDADGNRLEYEPSRRPTHFIICVMDCETVLHTIGHRLQDDYKVGNEHAKAGEAWVAERFPDWKNATAYWD